MVLLYYLRILLIGIDYLLMLIMYDNINSYINKERIYVMLHTKTRDYYFDNLKFILILLVVIGHTIEPLIDISGKLKILYCYIFSFHMPLFVFVSGYFSKNYIDNSKNVKSIQRFLIPYLLFQTLYVLFYKYLLNVPGTQITLVTPIYLMWYLLSAFVWILITPYFTKLKHCIPIAFILAILVGYAPDISTYLSLSRIIVFFPFYLIGYYINKSTIEKLFNKKIKIISLLILIVAFLTSLKIPTTFNAAWFYGRDNYVLLGSPFWYSGIFRIFIYIINILMCISVLSLTPNHKTKISKYGANTIYIYLFHGFIIKYFVFRTQIYQSIDNSLSKIVLIVISIIITFLLGSKFFIKLTKFLVEPQINNLFKKELQ